MTRKLIKRSIVINGHKTSIAIDDRTYTILKHIAKARGLTFYKLASEIEMSMKPGSFKLSETLRLYAVEWSLERVQTTGGMLLRKLLKDGGGTEAGFLINTMNWALDKAGIEVGVAR